ncbi:MAG: type II toxin-antitoxin system RelE/ParE family toxin [Bacteroidales bacterium]|nr:type II toxin-antitoxin system RelE/ParE family toxin [Bacteroidales bacterium]
MVKIVWTDLSVFELKEIYDYISYDSKRYAKNQVERIKQKTLILKNMPEIGRIVPELDNVEIRELIEGNYRIIYRIKTTDLVEILTVHHTSRDINNRDLMNYKA